MVENKLVSQPLLKITKNPYFDFPAMANKKLNLVVGC